MFDPSLQVVCSAETDELDATRRILRRRLDEAGVHPVISREMMLAFSEISTARETGSTDGVKVISDMAITSDELVLRVQTAVTLIGDERAAGEQELMLHLMSDSVERVVDGDQVVITIRKRRVGR